MPMMIKSTLTYVKGAKYIETTYSPHISIEQTFYTSINVLDLKLTKQIRLTSHLITTEESSALSVTIQILYLGLEVPPLPSFTIPTNRLITTTSEVNQVAQYKHINLTVNQSQCEWNESKWIENAALL